MNFNEKKPIYVQIADTICEGIVRGNHSAGSRIPSVREYAAQLEVNVNTVMRAFELLQGKDIIYNKRGLGYFVSDDAPHKVLAMKRERFLSEDVPEFFRQAELLGFTFEDLKEIHKKCLEERKNNK